jgi:flagellin-like hook-associated protein FlgL
MLSIQTNVNSLVAQQNLSVNNAFQSKTIQQLTSGYRINSSGDDAAGLAVANKYRSGVAELTQGVANGNDGVAQLQIMDGGMNNIAQMLDRLKTLAMQSASGSFTGSRTTLNSEFQTDLTEIDRQAQSVGLNTGGSFAKSLAVYLGAGSGSQSQTNSVVTVDLSKATVDSQSLGLSGVQAVNGTAYDLGAASATSVATIVANGANTTSAGGTADFTFYGPGFGDAGGVKIAINLSGVGDTASLVANVNAAIQSAASQAGGNYAAFKAAAITASIKTNASGQQMLSFTSSSAAFQVAANDKMANAFLGNFAAGSTGNAANLAGSTVIAGGSYELATAGTPNTEADLAWAGALVGRQSVTISANDATGAAHALTVNFNVGGAGNLVGDTMAHVLAAINGALQSSNDSTLQQITAVQDATGANINFISTNPKFSVAVTGDSGTDGQGAGAKGIAATNIKAALQVGTGGTADISTMAGAQTAVSAISNAVTLLGASQAAVGKGQNVLNYAISLAQSQITNFSAAQAQIRDADVAAEAANLSKAQVLQQSSIAAMAQANSAPQAVLALLKG